MKLIRNDPDMFREERMPCSEHLDESFTGAFYGDVSTRGRECLAHDCIRRAWSSTGHTWQGLTGVPPRWPEAGMG